MTAKGATTKTTFDRTVPFPLRARFKEVDASLWAPSLIWKAPE